MSEQSKNVIGTQNMENTAPLTEHTTPLMVTFDKRRRVTRRRNPNDEWDRDDTASDILDIVVELADDPERADLVAPFKAIEGKSYPLLYAVYSTGDSFSTHKGQVETVGLFETYEEAQKVFEILQQHNNWVTYDSRFSDGPPPPKNFDPYAVTFETKGRTITFGVPWSGYFENLQELVIHPCRVDMPTIRWAP